MVSNFGSGVKDGTRNVTCRRRGTPALTTKRRSTSMYVTLRGRPGSDEIGFSRGGIIRTLANEVNAKKNGAPVVLGVR